MSKARFRPGVVDEGTYGYNLSGYRVAIFFEHHSVRVHAMTEEDLWSLARLIADAPSLETQLGELADAAETVGSGPDRPSNSDSRAALDSALNRTRQLLAKIATPAPTDESA